MEQAQTPQSLQCPGCSARLIVGVTGEVVDVRCNQCSTSSAILAFPPRPSGPVTSHAAAALEGQTTCFFHPDRAASVPCDRCGRLVCALCDFRIGSRHLCPTCVGSGLEGKLTELIRSRVRWSSISLLCGVAPLLFGLFLWPTLPFTGAAAIFFCFYGWKKPGSLVRGPQKWAAVIGALLGLLQIAVSAGLVYFIWRAATSA